MRLVFVTDIMTPYMAAVFAELAKRCDFHAVFCAESGSRGTDWAFDEGLRFPYTVVGGAKLRREDNIDLHLDPRILAAVTRRRPDAAIAPAFSVPSLYAAIYATASRRGLVIHSDGIEHSELGLGRPQAVMRRVILRVAGACAANSGPAAERFAQLGVHQDKIFRANHTTRMEPLWAVARARNGSAPEGRLEVLSVGRLIPRKGLDQLLEAIALARQDQPGIRLTVVGSGPDEQPLRRQADRLGIDVAFRGFVDQPELPQVYGGADVFAMPSRMDPFGIVALEAAAAGLPIVGSHHAGATKELVREGETGFSIDPEDPVQIARSLVALARDPARRARMGQAAHESTLGRTPEAAADGYLAAARTAVAEPQRARRPAGR